MDKTSEFYATGRRKTSVARVRLIPGEGKRTVNGRPLEEYFPRDALHRVLEGPFETVGGDTRWDLTASVKGGGLTGQAGAIRLGVARALLVYDETLRKTLRSSGYLTRDPRKKERKKYGLAGARKKYQFSKR